MHTKNHLGNLGEDVVSLLLSRKIENAYRFSTKFLGEKTQLLDFVVNLLDAKGSEYGPFFFMQVKTTESVTLGGSGIPARFSSAEVRAAQARKVPVYLVAVESLNDDAENVYVLGIDSSLSAGITVVPRLFSLKQHETRTTIYDEVHAYFQLHAQAFQSRLTRGAATPDVFEESKDEKS